MLSEAYAQTDQIEKICKEYDEKLSRAAEEEIPESVPNLKVNCTLTKRAIGPVDHQITIYFDEHEHEVEDMGDELMKEAVIRKVEFEISAASYTVNYSYYFNEAGLLIKYVERSIGYECFLKQVYFNEKLPVRIQQDKITGDNCMSEKEAEVYVHTELSKKEKASATWLLEDADKFRQILFANYELFKD